MIQLRKASSMIELVFAIVVMGIAMMTLPLMLTRVQENNAFAMQQEAILMAQTEVGNIITYPWDEKSEDASFNVGILDTDSANYTRAARAGLVIADKRRKFFTTNPTSATAIGTDGDTFPDDIDDFDTHKNIGLVDSNDTNPTLGYKMDNNMSVTVKYISDATITPFDFNITSIIGTTNIKMIEVSLQNSQLDNNITLRAFSSNIGANQLLRKTFP